MVETSSALVALLAALLVVGRFRTSQKLRDLVLVQAFVVLAVANLLPNVLPTLLAGEDAVVRMRLLLVCGILAALSLALAALAGDTRLEGRRSSPLVALGVGLVSPAAGVVLLDVLRVEPTQTGLVRALYATAGILFALAALGFGVRRRREDDGLRQFLAVGCLLAASARLALVVSPDGFVWRATHPADILRLGFYVVLLAGAVDEIRGYWQRVAVLEERRRLARELHDGVAQELAFIGAEAARRNPRPDQLHRIAVAAQRALDESRRAISAMTRPLDQPLEEAVAEAAGTLALPAGTSVRLDLARGVSIDAVARDELVRILHEALTNAVNHGRASVVHVELRRTENLLTLSVVDDGVGFDHLGATGKGNFGLTAMRERATRLGAELVVSSAPGEGTAVEVRLPCLA